MIYTHNIPAGVYDYNAQTYTVDCIGGIIRTNNLGQRVVLAVNGTIQASNFSPMFALELNGLIRTYKLENSCKIEARQGIASV